MGEFEEFVDYFGFINAVKDPDGYSFETSSKISIAKNKGSYGILIDGKWFGRNPGKYNILVVINYNHMRKISEINHPIYHDGDPVEEEISCCLAIRYNGVVYKLSGRDFIRKFLLSPKILVIQEI